MFENVGKKSIDAFRHYLEHTLGFNKEMGKHLEKIVKNLEPVLGEMDKKFFKDFDKALKTVSSAKKWFADPKFRKTAKKLLERLNVTLKDPNTAVVLNHAKDILQSIYTALGANDGELIKNLSGTLKTVANLNDVVLLVKSYLTPTSIICFGVAGIFASAALQAFVNKLINGHDDVSQLLREQMKLLREQLLVDLDNGRFLRGQYLLQIIKCRSEGIAGANAPIFAQLEGEAQHYLADIPPLSPEVLAIMESVQLNLENALKSEHVEASNPSDVLDRVNMSTNMDVVLNSLYENSLTTNAIPLISPNSITWRSIISSCEQNGIVDKTMHKLSEELLTSINKLFGAITNKCVNAQSVLLEILQVVYNHDDIAKLKDKYQDIYPELQVFCAEYNASNEEHTKTLLKDAGYKLNDELALHDILVDLLRKRAFLEVSYQLFNSLRFPYNVGREIKLGLCDVGSMVVHPINTVVDMATFPYRLLRHPIDTPGNMLRFWWHRPVRALTSTAVTSAVTGGVTSLVSRFLPASTPALVAPESANVVSAAVEKSATGFFRHGSGAHAHLAQYRFMPYDTSFYFNRVSVGAHSKALVESNATSVASGIAAVDTNASVTESCSKAKHDERSPFIDIQQRSIEEAFDADDRLLMNMDVRGFFDAIGSFADAEPYESIASHVAYAPS